MRVLVLYWTLLPFCDDELVPVLDSVIAEQNSHPGYSKLFDELLHELVDLPAN